MSTCHAHGLRHPDQDWVGGEGPYPSVSSTVELTGSAGLKGMEVLLVAVQRRAHGQGKVTPVPSGYAWPYTTAATPAPVA